MWEFLNKPEHANALMAIFTVLIFFATVAYSVIALLQWTSMRESNKINRDSLVAVQRAFISFSVHVIPYATVPQNNRDRIPVIWQFDVPITNSGNTPTQSLQHAVHAVVLKDKISQSFDFNDFKNGNAMFIGPKDSPVSKTNPIPIANIANSWKGTEHIYIYGWASYHDIFPNTPLHITKFCYELSVGGNPESSTIPPTWYAITPIHNCADDECKTN